LGNLERDFAEMQREWAHLMRNVALLNRSSEIDERLRAIDVRLDLHAKRSQDQNTRIESLEATSGNKQILAKLSEIAEIIDERFPGVI
jgi:hypothetical protein